MANYDNSKDGLGATFPDRAIDGQEWSRVEPLITPSQLRRRQLMGIPLYSYIPDPNTGLYPEITDEDLADFIARSVSELELKTQLIIFPVQFDERHPFDRNYWNSYGYIKVEHRPVVSVEKLAFTPATGNDIFEINNAWLDSANFHKGQINIIPFVPAIAGNFVAATGSSTPSGFAYLQILQGLAWVPALVRVTYTAGFPNGQIPRVINEAIGITAALEILNLLQATNRYTSSSLNIDGQGQSRAGPGPQVYQARIEFLTQKREEIVRKLKNIYGLSIIGGYV